jgi:predicted permease
MNGFDSIRRDAVLALRLLRKTPVFTGAVVMTLALGVGINTAVFSVVNAVLLRPLPVREAGRLVVIATRDSSHPTTLRGVSFPDLQDYRAGAAHVFEDVAGYSVGFVGLAADDARPHRVLATWVTGNYFGLLGIHPAAGRFVRMEEDGPGRTDPIVVLGHAAWQRRFQSDPSVIGRTVRVNGRPCTIVGVAPAGFRGTFAFSDAELYLPLNWAGAGGLDDRRARSVHALGRLRSGVTLEQAQAAMDVVADRLARAHPAENGNVGTGVLPERLARPEEDQARTNAAGAGVMLALVALVMVVATVNVVNLLLARATGRRKEFAIRAALGAGRTRLIEQGLTEGLILAAGGGAAGILVGAWAARALAALPIAGDLPVRFEFQLDHRVLGYSTALAAIAGLLAGFAPVRQLAGSNPGAVLRQLRSTPPPARGKRGRRWLVAAQIASCFVLVAAAGLFVRSLVRAESADLGFRADGVLNVHMDVGQLGYTEAQGRAFFAEIERRVRAVPGVGGVSFAFTVPMGYIRIGDAVAAEGRAPADHRRLEAGKNIVSRGYFETMGIRIVAGRSFTDGDDERSRPVAVVNQRLAERLWPGQDPVGKRFRGAGPGHAWIEVVGVAGTGKYRTLFESPQPYFYVPITQEYVGLRVLHVRSSTAADALSRTVERVIRSAAPDLPLYDVQTMRDALGSAPGLFPVRVAAAAAAALGLLAFALAIVGLYGVVAGLTAQRTHEIGVRVALGATPRDVLGLVLRDGVVVVLQGLAAGLLAVLAGSRVMEGLLFDVSPRDPATLVILAAALGGVALIACAIPARRAARLDPTAALLSD